MPRINSVTTKQLAVTAPDNTKDQLISQRGFFSPGSGFDNFVSRTLRQADGKIIVVGRFTTFNGQSRNRIVRLNTDGSEDTAFYANLGSAFNNTADGLWAVAQQADGKILVGGDFSLFNGQSRNRIVRLNLDGTEDTGFQVAGGPAGFVRDLVLQPDGKILVGSSIGSRRLNTDGDTDIEFSTNVGVFNGVVRKIALQADGRILFAGDFTTYGAQTRNRLVRLNANGSENTTFYTNMGSAFQNIIWTLLVQADGKIVVGGQFGVFNGLARSQIVRLNADGTEDTAFYTNLGAFGDRVLSLAQQSDGKILVGGNFTTLADQGQVRLARLNADGSRDTSYPTFQSGGPTGEIWGILVLPDGSVIITGNYTNLGSDIVNRIVKLDSQGVRAPGFRPATYTVTTGVNDVDENEELTLTISTSYISNGTVVRWRILDRSEDFSANTDTVTVTDNAASFTITPTADLLLEGTETFRVQLEKPRGAIVATTSEITIIDTST